MRNACLRKNSDVICMHGEARHVTVLEDCSRMGKYQMACMHWPEKAVEYCALETPMSWHIYRFYLVIVLFRRTEVHWLAHPVFGQNSVLNRLVCCALLGETGQEDVKPGIVGNEKWTLKTKVLTWNDIRKLQLVAPMHISGSSAKNLLHKCMSEVRKICVWYVCALKPTCNGRDHGLQKVAWDHLAARTHMHKSTVCEARTLGRGYAYFD